MKTCLATALVGLAATVAQAGETTVYESCTDVGGRTVAAEVDYNLPVLVRSDEGGGAAAIRYNPTLLPRLKPVTRLFFFARECAAQGRRAAAGAAGPTQVEAHQADCLAIAALTGAGLLPPADLAVLRDDLHFSAAEWPLLPGPPRDFDFSACPRRDVVKLPLAAMPAAPQASWNTCVRACADRSLACQKACRGETCLGRCQSAYDACESACAARPGQ
jgi:hypothetical protein